METVYLLLGSNLGDRMDFLERAVGLITRRAGRIVKTSGVYETAPWKSAVDLQYLNQAVCIETALMSQELLRVLLDTERDLGRVRDGQVNGPRTIDIDILFYASQIIDVAGLTVPHPRLHMRRFVLVPLYEIAPDYIHPVFNRSVRQLLFDCSDSLAVEPYAEQRIFKSASGI